MKDRINILIAKRDVIKSDLLAYQKALKDCVNEKVAAEEARSILQLAAKKTQEKLEVHFSDLVTKAFQAVLKKPYNFSSKFIERRNKTECDLKLERDGVYYAPKFTSGGGVIDIASFALRLAYWKLEKSSPVIIFDEPFRFSSKSMLPKIAEMLKALSTEFKLQVILITHIPELAEIADKVFEIENGSVVN